MIRPRMPVHDDEDFESADNADDDQDAPASKDDPSEADVSDDDDAETVRCPYCGKPIYERAELCPYCKSYISDEDAPRRHPRWIWAGVVCCLIAVAVWVFSRWH